MQKYISTYHSTCVYFINVKQIYSTIFHEYNTKKKLFCSELKMTEIEYEQNMRKKHVHPGNIVPREVLV